MAPDGVALVAQAGDLHLDDVPRLQEDTPVRALTAHCAEAPDRRYGLGTVPLQPPDLAVARPDAAGLAPADRVAGAGGNALDLLLKGRTR